MHRRLGSGGLAPRRWVWVRTCRREVLVVAAWGGREARSTPRAARRWSRLTLNPTPKSMRGGAALGTRKAEEVGWAWLLASVSERWGTSAVAWARANAVRVPRTAPRIWAWSLRRRLRRVLELARVVVAVANVGASWWWDAWAARAHGAAGTLVWLRVVAGETQRRFRRAATPRVVAPPHPPPRPRVPRQWWRWLRSSRTSTARCYCGVRPRCSARRRWRRSITGEFSQLYE